MNATPKTGVLSSVSFQLADAGQPARGTRQNLYADVLAKVIRQMMEAINALDERIKRSTTVPR